MGKIYTSIRNGQLIRVIKETAEQVTIKYCLSGEERNISPATLKRWWRRCEDEEITEDFEEPVAEAIIEIIEEEVIIDGPTEEKPINEGPSTVEIEKEEEEIQLEEKIKEEKPVKKVRVEVEQLLKDFIEKLADERGTEIFQATVPNFRSLKVDGRMYMAFTFSKKGIILWMRSDAITNLIDYKKMKHMFDARVHFSENNQKNKDMIEKLLDTCLEHQRNRRIKKTK